MQDLSTWLEIRAGCFPDVHIFQSPLNLIPQDGDRACIANRAASFCSTSRQASVSVVSLETCIESVQLISHSRVRSYNGGFASEGADCPQSLPQVSRVIELKIRLHLPPVPEFSSFHCTSESIACCFVLSHIPQHKPCIVRGCAHIHRGSDYIIHT